METDWEGVGLWRDVSLWAEIGVATAAASRPSQSSSTLSMVFITKLSKHNAFFIMYCDVFFNMILNINYCIFIMKLSFHN